MRLPLGPNHMLRAGGRALQGPPVGAGAVLSEWSRTPRLSHVPGRYAWAHVCPAPCLSYFCSPDSPAQAPLWVIPWAPEPQPDALQLLGVHKLPDTMGRTGSPRPTP